MKRIFFSLAMLGWLSAFESHLSIALAQGTAITYQGRLDENGRPANGSYDLQFALFDAALSGSQLGGAVAIDGVAVSNGLFTVALDFGASAFLAGADRWLFLSVKTNGAVIPTPLSPPQRITPVPYALTAGSLSGALPSANLSGAYGNAVALNNTTNFFSGTFAGSGRGLTNISAQGITNLLGYITPNQYANGIPDGVTDNTAAIQQGINDSGLTGKTFFLTPPTDASKFYVVSSTLYVTNFGGCNLDGGGSGLLYSAGTATKSSVRYTGTGKFMVITNSAGFSEIDGIFIRNLQVYCPSKASVGVWQDTTTGASHNLFRFENVSIFNCKTAYVFRAVGNSDFRNLNYSADYGIDFGGTSGAQQNYSVNFSQCSGFQIPGSGAISNAFTIRSGTVHLQDMDINTYAGGISGLIIEGSARVVLENCNLESYTTAGWANICMTNISGADLTVIGGRVSGVNGPALEIGDGATGVSIIRGAFLSQNAAGCIIVSHVPNFSFERVRSDTTLRNQSGSPFVVTNVVHHVAYALPAFGNGVTLGSLVPQPWSAMWAPRWDGVSDGLLTTFSANGVQTTTDLLGYYKDKYLNHSTVSAALANTFTASNFFNGDFVFDATLGNQMIYQCNGVQGPLFRSANPALSIWSQIGAYNYTQDEFGIYRGTARNTAPTIPFFWSDLANNRTSIGHDADSQPAGTATLNVEGTLSISSLATATNGFASWRSNGLPSMTISTTGYTNNILSPACNVNVYLTGITLTVTKNTKILAVSLTGTMTVCLKPNEYLTTLGTLSSMEVEPE